MIWYGVYTQTNDAIEQKIRVATQPKLWLSGATPRRGRGAILESSEPKRHQLSQTLARTLSVRKDRIAKDL
jgi:hypothetical protein